MDTHTHTHTHTNTHTAKEPYQHNPGEITAVRGHPHGERGHDPALGHRAGLFSFHSRSFFLP
jgi:hypothetical protein